MPGAGGGGPIDPLAVLAALGVAGAGTVAPVAGGTDTAIWRVEGPGGPAALRVFRPDQARACAGEVAAMTAAAGAGLPVPALRARGAWRDHPALLLDWCPGRTLDEELQRRPWRVWPLGLAFGRLQARIHAVPWGPRPGRGDQSRSSGAGDPGRGGNAAAVALLPLSRPGAPDWMAWAGPVDAPLASRLVADPRPAALLHLDYHPRNVLTDGRRLTAVLDWTNARPGDPRADAARTLSILRLAPRPPGGSSPRSPLDTVLRRALAAAWRRGYRRGAGDSGGALTDMAPFYAWAGEVLVRDLGKHAARPGSWLRPAALDPARRWTAGWRRRAGL